MAKKEVATKNEGSMTFNSERPDYIKEGERGQEGVSMDDLTIPRLDVLQDLSPQRKKNDPAYIEGAEEGMLFNTVTGALYGTECFFVPCYYKKEWLIWQLQAAGGGFNGAFESEDEAKAEFEAQGYGNEMFKKDGQDICSYEIVDTANHFGLVFNDEDDVQEVCVSMSKSKMKINRQLNTLVKMSGGDRFSRVYKISAVEDTNKANQKYYNFKIGALGYATEQLYKMGEKMYLSLKDSERSANYSDKSATAKTEEPSEESEY